MSSKNIIGIGNKHGRHGVSSSSRYIELSGLARDQRSHFGESVCVCIIKLVLDEVFRN